MDETTEIRRAVDTGKVLLGLRETEKNVLKGNGKLVVVSNNLNEKEREKLEHVAKLSDIKIYFFKGNSIQLGSVCGKPFPVSVLLIQKEGKSDILTITK